MRGCLRLSRLPHKATLKSLNFRRVTPGTPSPWFGAPPTPGGLINPQHPFARRGGIRIAPNAVTEAFTIKAIPKTCLYHPDSTNTPHGNQDAPSPWPGNRRLNMSILNFMSKAKIHKGAYVRKKVAQRVHCAFALVMTRGADCEKDKRGRQVLIFKEEDIGEQWISQDWTYILWPKLEAFRMPWPQLVQCSRAALSSLSQQMKRLEAQWSGDSVSHANTSKSVKTRSRTPSRVSAPSESTPKGLERAAPLRESNRFNAPYTPSSSSRTGRTQSSISSQADASTCVSRHAPLPTQSTASVSLSTTITSKLKNRTPVFRAGGGKQNTRSVHTLIPQILGCLSTLRPIHTIPASFPFDTPNTPAYSASREPEPEAVAATQPPQDYHSALNEAFSAQAWAEQPSVMHPVPYEQADKLDTATKVQMSKRWSEDASFVRALIQQEEERKRAVHKAQRQVLEQLGFRVVGTAKSALAEGAEALTVATAAKVEDVVDSVVDMEEAAQVPSADATPAPPVNAPWNARQFTAAEMALSVESFYALEGLSSAGPSPHKGRVRPTKQDNPLDAEAIDELQAVLSRTTEEPRSRADKDARSQAKTVPSKSRPRATPVQAGDNDENVDRPSPDPSTPGDPRKAPQQKSLAELQEDVAALHKDVEAHLDFSIYELLEEVNAMRGRVTEWFDVVEIEHMCGILDNLESALSFAGSGEVEHALTLISASLPKTAKTAARAQPKPASALARKTVASSPLSPWRTLPPKKGMDKRKIHTSSLSSAQSSQAPPRKEPPEESGSDGTSDWQAVFDRMFEEVFEKPGAANRDSNASGRRGNMANNFGPSESSEHARKVTGEPTETELVQDEKDDGNEEDVAKDLTALLSKEDIHLAESWLRERYEKAPPRRPVPQVDVKTSREALFAMDPFNAGSKHPVQDVRQVVEDQGRKRSSDRAQRRPRRPEEQGRSSVARQPPRANAASTSSAGNPPSQASSSTPARATDSARGSLPVNAKLFASKPVFVVPGKVQRKKP